MTDDGSAAEAAAHSLGKQLKAAREAAGLSQSEAAKALGVASITVSRWERDAQPIKRRDLKALAELYRMAPFQMVPTTSRRIGEPVPRDTSDDEPWSPNPALRGIIPERAYEVAVGYCRRLAAAGLPNEAVEDAERLFIDPRYAKANSRKGRELDENDWIMLIDARWESMREALSWTGIRV